MGKEVPGQFLWDWIGGLNTFTWCLLLPWIMTAVLLWVFFAFIPWAIYESFTEPRK